MIFTAGRTRALMRSNSVRLLLWLPALAFLTVFFFYPLARILTLGLSQSAFTAENFSLLFSAAVFTFYQATLSLLLTFVLGIPSAILFSRFEFPAKSFLRALTAVPFMLPTVVVAAGFNALFGPRGWLNLTFFPSHPIPFVGTLGAILIAHVFYNTTIVIRIVGNALTHLDVRLEQAARTLGADTAQVWRSIILPLLRGPLLAAGLLVFLFDFTSFGVILLLGGPRFATLEVETYIQALQFLNLPMAAVLTIFQLLCTLVFSIIYSRVVTQSLVPTMPRPVIARAPKSLRERVFTFSMLGLLIAFFALPLLALPLRSVTRLDADRGDRSTVQRGLTTDYYTELFINRRGSIFYVPPAEAARNSLGYAAATVILSLVLGAPVASALARPGRLEKILDPLLLLPLGASAVTLGLGFIVAFSRLLASPWLVPLAHTLIALPFVIRILQPALASIPDRLRQAAAALGASPLRVWLTVDWPIIRRATLTAATFAFTISMGEFGAAFLLTRPEYPTLPVAIYRFLSQPGGLNYGQAMAMSTILMTITVLAVLWIERTRLPGAGDF